MTRDPQTLTEAADLIADMRNTIAEQQDEIRALRDREETMMERVMACVPESITSSLGTLHGVGWNSCRAEMLRRLEALRAAENVKK